MVFIVEFVGRRIGAIGITYPIKKIVRADNWDEAVQKLYQTYEHIRVVSYEVVPDDGDNDQVKA